jgi:hypothetical protein
VRRSREQLRSQSSYIKDSAKRCSSMDCLRGKRSDMARLREEGQRRQRRFREEADRLKSDASRCPNL